MAENIVAVFIPIVSVLVIGIILVSFFFFRSRERQLLIEKGMDAQSIKEFFEGKKDPLRMLKVGIVTIAFGLGLGFGIMMEVDYGGGFWVPLLMFTLTGVGFVVANVVARKIEKSN
jgi:hypothetical protein